MQNDHEESSSVLKKFEFENLIKTLLTAPRSIEFYKNILAWI